MQDCSSENRKCPRKQEEIIATLRVNNIQSVKRLTGDFIRTEYYHYPEHSFTRLMKHLKT